MTVRNLDALFHPKSIAVIGASNRPGTVGAVVLRNLLASGATGPILPVNPKYTTIGGVLAYPDVESLPLTPDLAVICTPARVVPRIVEALRIRGSRAAIVLTAGLSDQSDEQGKTLEQCMLEATGDSGLRILGPNCLGLLAPSVGLNASFAHLQPDAGSIAFVSQSGALCTAVLDWAQGQRIGFSHFISLGNQADIDFGDVLDYLGSDPGTSAILLYIESVLDARKFLSAARAAARNKQVLVIKAGRGAEGARAVASHTGALAGSDAVYDVAFRRAGMLRVFRIEQLFGAVETLARARPPRGNDLVILTNGGGPGVLAADALSESGGHLTPLSERTLEELDAVLPATWSRANPIDIIGDATPERYEQALRCVLEAEGSHTVLVAHVPTALSSSADTARAVADLARQSKRTVLTSWLGRHTAAAARRSFIEAGVPTYDTPEQAVEAFLHVVRYRRNQEMLLETPSSAPAEVRPNRDEALATIHRALEEGRDMLSEPESKAVLAAYGIPVVETRLADGPASASRLAAELGFPVALKIVSPELTHKSDVGGVVLDLENEDAVQRAAEGMARRIRAARPDARVSGFSVQRMARRPGAYELIVGMTTDAVFGPVLLVGQGGTAVEVLADRAIGLPPLNMNLAREMLSRTRIARLLRGYRDRPAVDLDAVCLTLLQFSQMVIDIGEVVEAEVNPLFADENGVLALDARMRIVAAQGAGADRLAIRPYPGELEEETELDSGERLLLRPIRPEDEAAHHAFLSRLGPEDVRFRFFGLVRAMPHTQMARYTQIDYNREMAFIATAPGSDGRSETYGVVRTVFDPDNISAEFAIVVRSDIKGQGLGRALLEKMIRYCRERGAREIVGQVLRENQAMLGLAKRLRFEVEPATADDDAVGVRLILDRNAAPSSAR